jgi:hypothetical protein
LLENNEAPQIFSIVLIKLLEPRHELGISGIRLITLGTISMSPLIVIEHLSMDPHVVQNLSLFNLNKLK